ncbi:unnamed protein product, partial [Prorocentrum cordatum]
HQFTVAEFSAYHLRSVIQHLDGLTIARTAKLTTGCRGHAEDELVEAPPTDTPHGVETEFHGGEGVDPDEPENEAVDLAERSPPLFGALNVKQLTGILTRAKEFEAAKRPGRKSQELKQMNTFDDLCHAVLRSPSPENDVAFAQVQRSYGSPLAGLTAALDMQDAIMKHLKRTATMQGDMPVDDIDPIIPEAALHNLQQQRLGCEWIDLTDALQGPAHVANMLVRRCQERRSTPTRPYKLNEEQLQCIALFATRLEQAFLGRPDPSEPRLHPARAPMTTIMDGGGGCGKTTLSAEILLPLLETFFHPEGGLTPESSTRTHALALNVQTRQKLAVAHVDAGALCVDEHSQLLGELNRAGALRTTHAREAKYGLNKNAVRFTDETLIDILNTMWAPGGSALMEQQWQALKDTEVSAEQPDIPASWYHSCYCWSVISMAAFMLAQQSAREAQQTLFYVQAVDQAKATIPETNTAQFYEDLLRIPSIQKTRRLPPVVLFHYDVRVRLTTTIQKPFAAQDVEGTAVGFDPGPADLTTKSRLFYVKLDECDIQLLPPAVCPEHPERSSTCARCTSAAQPGVMAIRPKPRTFKHFFSPTEKARYVIISRTQIPLMPAAAVPLYSMQGTTADPGLVADWFFPQRCTDTIRWLIVYVMLSRPRSLATLKSVNLTKQIRDIIEQRPPGDLVANFDRLFREKVEATRDLARDAARAYALLTSSTDHHSTSSTDHTTSSTDSSTSFNDRHLTSSIDHSTSAADHHLTSFTDSTFPENTYRISEDHVGDSESTYGNSEGTYGLTGSILGAKQSFLSAWARISMSRHPATSNMRKADLLSELMQLDEDGCNMTVEMLRARLRQIYQAMPVVGAPVRHKKHAELVRDATTMGCVLHGKETRGDLQILIAEKVEANQVMVKPTDLMPFGRHRGKTLQTPIEQEREYAGWLLSLNSYRYKRLTHWMITQGIKAEDMMNQSKLELPQPKVKAERGEKSEDPWLLRDDATSKSKEDVIIDLLGDVKVAVNAWATSVQKATWLSGSLDQSATPAWTFLTGAARVNLM